MSNINNYEEVKKFYVENLHFPDMLVEYLSNEEILYNCVEGRSNSYIASKFDIDTENVRVIIRTYLGFTGWEKDLDFNPLDIFEISSRLLDSYGFNLCLISPTITDEQIISTFFICKVWTEVRERMDNEYYRT